MPLFNVQARRRRDAKVDRMAALPPFRGCSHEELLTAAAALELVTIPAGRRLAREGRRADQAFLVLSGTVAVEVAGERRATAGAGTPIGTSALLDRWHDQHTVVALEDVEALVVTRPALVQLTRTAPGIAWPLLRDLRVVRRDPSVARPARPATPVVTPRPAVAPGLVRLEPTT